ncbi:MAG: hypothetical protein IH600_15065 [Bacteroidetes bacterium]|nr:hypothetical protein [Bacteroidota bacterium]
MQLQRPQISKLDRNEAEFERQRFEYYASERASHFDDRAREAWELYHNDRDGTDTQYTRKQIEDLEEASLPQVSINYIYPIIANQRSVLTADRPSGRVVPVGGPQDKIKAYLFDAVLAAMWRYSLADAHYRKAMKDMLITYLGCMVVEPQSFYTQGKFRLSYSHVSWDDAYIDPSAKMSGLSFQDAESIIIARLLPSRKVMNIYGFVPDDRGQNLKTDESRVSEEQNNQQVLIRNVYEKIYGIYGLFNVPNETHDGHYVTRRVFAGEQSLDAFREKYQAKLVDYREGVYVRRRTIIGLDDLYEEKILPLTVYPTVFYTPDDYNSPFGKSPVEYMREPQKALNKFTQQTIHQASLGSLNRWIAPMGGIVNKDAVVKYGATSGTIIEYKPNPNLPNGGKPEQLQVMPLAAAWYQLGAEMKADMEYTAGRPSFVQGDPTGAPDTARASMQVGEYANLRPREMKARCETSTTFLTRASMEYIAFFADRESIVRHIDDREEFVDVPLDAILDDTKIIDHDVIPAVKTTLPTDRIEMKESLKLAMQQTADPRWQELVFEELMEQQDTAVADRMRKKYDVVQDLQSQLQQAQEENKKKEAIIDRLSTEVIYNKQQVAIVRAEGDIKAEKASTLAKMDAALGALDQPPKDKQAQQQMVESL